ncbi:MAG TPA: glycosyl hydrolase [Rheinheimera sp.]|nr:glycosyl hydrolase [Rheinheimera sp.]
MADIRKSLIAAGVSGAVLLSATVLVVPFEGKVNKVYVDPANILTSCYGHTGRELKKGMQFTDEQCLDQLATDLAKHDKQMLSAVTVPLSEGEHAAYLSFVYNVGVGSWQQSTLLKLLNKGARLSACEQLKRWIYIDGQPSKGLANRRQAEYTMCIKDLK